MIANRDAWPFREAVKEKDAPNYFEIIKTPIDLQVISEKVDEKAYQNFHQLECDLRLIVNNSEQYNGEFNGFTTNSKAVWRLFRKLTKKYLNHDLSVEDHEAFIFPPRINYAKKRDASSIDQKKKLKKQKKSSKFQALELLYNATQDSIESTFQRFAFSPASDSENKQLNENLPKKYQFTSEKPSGFYNEQLANLDHYSYQDGFYTEENRNENLVFKSLNEWNKQIDEDGLSIVLPDKTIFVNYSPVDVNWLTNFPNDQPHYKTVFNETLFQKPIDGQLHNGQLIINRHSLHCKKEKSSRGRKGRAGSRRRANDSKTSNGKNSRTNSEDCEMSVDEERNGDEERKVDDEKVDEKDGKVEEEENNFLGKDNLVEKNSLNSVGLASDGLASDGLASDGLVKAGRIQADSILSEHVKKEPLPDDDLETKEEHLVKETKQIDLNESHSQENHSQKNGESGQKKRLIVRLKLSKLNNDWKPISLNGSQEKDSNQSGSSSDSLSDSSTCCSSSCSSDSDS